MRWEYTGLVLLVLVFAGTFYTIQSSKITGLATRDLSLKTLQFSEGIEILATEPGRVKVSEKGKVSWRPLPEHLTSSNLLNAQVTDEDLRVIIVLKDQPLSQISRTENQKARSTLTENAEQIKKIRRKAKLGIKEVQEIGAIRAEVLLQSRMSEEDKAQIEIVKRHIDATKDQVKKNILAKQAVATLESRKDAKSVIESCGGEVTGGSALVNSLFAKIPSACLLDLASAETVLAVYEDKMMEATLDYSVCATGAETWYNGSYNGSTWDLAVADTGIDGTHPALEVDYADVFHTTASLASNYADNATDPDDYHGHGTHIGGTIASSNETYKGIAYGMDALINAKFGYLTNTSGGSGYWSDAMDAIDWAINVTEGADVISFSFGGTTFSDDTSMARYFDALVDDLGIHAAVAAGNSGSFGQYTIGDPAIAYNIFSVANNDDKNTCAYIGDVTDDSIRSSSSQGPTIGERVKPDIGAPGTNIIATAYDWEGAGVEDDWVSMTGTSMATPHIAGAILLVLDYYGYNRDPRAVKALLLNSANNTGSSFSDPIRYGWGELDLTEAYVQKDLVIEDNVTEDFGYRLYKLNVTTRDRATLVWNRHVEYIGSTYPSTYYSLNDLDLHLFEESDNTEDDSSTSGVDNVEQVNASSSYDGVIKVLGWSTNFTHGLDYEDFALAAEDILVPATGPSFALDPQFTLVDDSQLPHTVYLTVANTGDLNAHNVTVQLNLPGGVSIQSGDNPQFLGTINVSDNNTAVWNITTSIIDVNHTGITANITSESYGINFTADLTDEWFAVYDDDTTPPSFLLIDYPIQINITDVVNVSANITDTSGVANATIYYDYSSDGSLDGIVDMSLSSGLWVGAIPAPGKTHEDKNISFYINATDADSDRAGDGEAGTTAIFETHVIDSDVDDDGYSDTIYGGLDCNDINASINPNATEIPYNSIDDDCNASTTDDDIDSDGYNSTLTGGLDCNDNNASIAPNATEIPYNGYDDDCNILSRDDDLDTDGYNSTTTGGTDCNDMNSSINPGQSEIPYNGYNDDCNATTLDDDLDSDGFNSSATGGLDCNDTNPFINPAQSEVPYNGVDEDCNVSTADDDIDSDGYNSTVTGGPDCNDGNSSINPGQTEIPYNGYNDDCNATTVDDDLDTDGYNSTTTGGMDCNDSNSNVNPGELETIYNGIDDDCNATTLDDDLDGDGYINANDCDDNNASINPGQTEIPYNGYNDDCNATTPDDDIDNDAYNSVVTGGLDCDDNNVSINPDQTELTYNGADDDCNNLTLDDDLDTDGYNSTTTGGSDCDDANASINPDATEVPYNGADDDCNIGSTDDDIDIDGYNSTITGGTDCDDNNGSINPGQLEVAYNGYDDDCNATTVDDDLDIDGYNSTTTGGADCDDGDGGINPGANETIDDIDQDCVNDAPVLDFIADVTVNETDIVQLTPTATDFDDSSSIVFNYTPPLDGTGGWETTLNDSGVYVVTVIASDGQSTDSQNVTITVLNLPDIDDDGIADRDDPDDDNDGFNDTIDPLTGNETHINTTLNISVEIESSTNLGQLFNGTLNVSIKDGNETVTEFDFDFDNNTLNLANLSIEKQTGGASKGAVLIQGLDLGNGTKSVYVDNIDAGSTGVCLKDEAVVSIAEVSDACTGSGEIKLSCPGTSGAYSCSVSGGKYRVSGLHHSAISEFTQPSGGSGGGGGGGGGGSSTTDEETLIVPTSEGFEVVARVGQKLKIVSQGTTFTLKIQTITTDAVVFLDIRTGKTPFVAESFTLKYDLDGDLRQDIEIVLIDAAVNKATMLLKTYTPPERPTFAIPTGETVVEETEGAIVEEAEAPITKVEAEAATEEPPVEPVEEDSFPLGQIIALGVGGLIILTVLIVVLTRVSPRHREVMEEPKAEIEKVEGTETEPLELGKLEPDEPKDIKHLEPEYTESKQILKEEENITDIDKQIKDLDSNIDEVEKGS